MPGDDPLVGHRRELCHRPRRRGFHRHCQRPARAHGAPGASCCLVCVPIELQLREDVGFDGFDPGSGERFSGRAGGGSSVTIYDSRQDFFQYAVVSDQGL